MSVCLRRVGSKADRIGNLALGVRSHAEATSRVRGLALSQKQKHGPIAKRISSCVDLGKRSLDLLLAHNFRLLASAELTFPA
jgi:hypothetical protein